jgi:hypothetical protein
LVAAASNCCQALALLCPFSTFSLFLLRYRIFQNFKPVAIGAVPVDERKKLGGGSEQAHFDTWAEPQPGLAAFRLALAKGEG